jgi:hypothetical protein
MFSQNTPSLEKLITDQFMTDKIIHIVGDFQMMEIEVRSRSSQETKTVPVHVPYMFQTVSIIDKPKAFVKLPKRHQDRLIKVKANRDNAPETVKEFLQSHCYLDGRELFVAQGRADVDEIRGLLQAAVDQGIVPTDQDKQLPDSNNLRNWLKHFGIGIDCSAFVQHTLTRLVKACFQKMGADPKRYLDYEVGWMRAASLYTRLRTDPPSSERFEVIHTPREARPGDILVKKGHIRLVAKVLTLDDNNIILEMTESTSAKDISNGLQTEEDDIGPRLIQVHYPEPDLPISQQSPSQKGPINRFTPESDESCYFLGRLKVLSHHC